MSELGILEQRLQLVELSASLQRATIERRLAAVEARPSRTLINLIGSVASRPIARQLAFAAAAFAWRAFRRRRRT
ncbi:hypothetical protein [Usitatibacter palustris]|uniref:Uncharacterized protein n=1 Tax=Usitatibacter palustris TaxID=2732487 RepID=A0A6M4H2A2_9PROT|nr:hypothetical protein [Usitatibacter palustris]QJR13462.1 hypothetical protein DSM104440_00246 [Usitatibacter palustris]